MNAIFRTLLTWLVLLAIPFQGYAAAAALPCTAIGGGAVPAASTQQRAMPMTSGMHHDHHAMLMAAQHKQSAHASHGGAAHDTGVHAKCGSCPACWAGPAMMPPAASVAATQPPARAAIPFHPGHVPSFHPSLPERPPRPALA